MFCLEDIRHCLEVVKNDQSRCWHIITPKNGDLHRALKMRFD